MRNLILMSHGNMAREVLASAEMIVGTIQNVHTLCMSAEEGLAGISNKLKTVLDECKGSDILVIADLFGGTPFNAAVLAKGENFEIVTGLNLGMVIEYSVSQIDDLVTLAEFMETTGKRGITVQKSAEDDDEIDF